MTKRSLMKVENIAECSPWKILHTFDLHQVIPGFENQFLIFFESGRFTQVLLYSQHARSSDQTLQLKALQVHLYICHPRPVVMLVLTCLFVFLWRVSYKQLFKVMMRKINYILGTMFKGNSQFRIERSKT